MEAQNINSRCWSMEVHKKIGGDCGAGNMMAGSSYAGDEPKFIALYQAGNFAVGIAQAGDCDEINGIYHRRNKGGEKIIAKLKWYVTKNPRTENQQANRQKFAQAIASWQGLTEVQKAVYNLRMKNQRGTGFNLYLREYMIN